MKISIEQAHALVAVARSGSFVKAAESLGKSHTALVYALKNMEQALNVSLLDRTGYRTSLTDLGKIICERCEDLIKVASDLEDLCTAAGDGWETRLGVVVDGIIPVEPLIGVLETLRRTNDKIRLTLSSDFLGGVEQRFSDERAVIMATVLPPLLPGLISFPLPVIPAHLVVHKSHPLAAQKKLTESDLRKHTFLTVRGSDNRLQMPTSMLEKLSTFHLSDFHAKKSGLINGYGYGWMPEYLIGPELKKKTLVPLKWSGGVRHEFEPNLYVVREAMSGRGVQMVLKSMGLKSLL